MDFPGGGKFARIFWITRRFAMFDRLVFFKRLRPNNEISINTFQESSKGCLSMTEFRHEIKWSNDLHCSLQDIIAISWCDAVVINTLIQRGMCSLSHAIGFFLSDSWIAEFAGMSSCALALPGLGIPCVLELMIAGNSQAFAFSWLWVSVALASSSFCARVVLPCFPEGHEF